MISAKGMNLYLNNSSLGKDTQLGKNGGSWVLLYTNDWQTKCGFQLWMANMCF